jgi:hypothetical protein
MLMTFMLNASCVNTLFKMIVLACYVWGLSYRGYAFPPFA